MTKNLKITDENAKLKEEFAVLRHHSHSYSNLTDDHNKLKSAYDALSKGTS